MKINRILCPIDYSSYSNAANYYASLLADAAGAQIIYLNVNWPPSNDPVQDRLDELFTKLSTEIKPHVENLWYTHEVRDGDPAQEILALADEQSVDLIVMGTYGATGLERILYGSVCGKVLRQSKCPVMAVKDSLKSSWPVHEAGLSLSREQPS